MASKRLRQPVHLVLDWDGTLTVKDTLSAIGSIPQFRDQRLQRRHDPSINWQEISRAYANDFKGHKESRFPRQPIVSDAEYREWLNSLKPVEMRSALRAQSSGFFHGVTTEDVKTAAKTSLENGSVALRPGWAELFEMFLVERSSPEEPNAASRISIISVSWSETFIRWTLWYAAQALDHPRKDDICQLINDMEIFANELHGLSSPLGCSGRLVLKRALPIQTSADKAKYLPAGAGRRTSQDSTRSSISGALSPPPPSTPGVGNAVRSRLPSVVYVGDSATDYECLKAADTGVWLAGVEEAQHAERFKEVFSPLQIERLAFIGSGEVGPDSLLWTPDLHAVTHFLASS